MKSALKLTTTISILAAVSLMAACGSKKSAPAAEKADGAPTTAAPATPTATDKGSATPGTVPSTGTAADSKQTVDPKKVLLGNFTGVELGCDERTATDESVKKFKGTVLVFNEDTSYTITEQIPGNANPPSEIGTYTLTPDAEKKESGQVTLQESFASFGEDPAPVVASYGVRGDDLILKVEDKALCPTEKYAVKKFKRTSALEAKAKK